jgi:hypothetical protein
MSSGCAVAHHRAITSAAPGPVVVGEVAVVDEEERFVLIDLGSNLSVPPPGAALWTKNAKGLTSHLRASSEQKRPFIAADILDDTPAVGDEVLR